MTKDIRQGFSFPELGIRGVMVSLESGWQDLLSRRQYEPTAISLLGELCAVANLMGSTIKFDGRLTLQIQSEAALKLGVVQYYSNGSYRGMMDLNFGGVLLDDKPLDELAKDGKLVISIQKAMKDGKMSDPYQGVVPIKNPSLSEAVETYFNQSEQLKTEIKLFANQNRAFGVLLQAMPDNTASDDDWTRLKMIIDTLTVSEMQDDTLEQLVRKLFVEDDIALYDAQALDFSCGCSEETTLAMLGTLDVASLRDIIEHEGQAIVECDFCGKSYEHKRDVLDALVQNKLHPN